MNNSAVPRALFCAPLPQLLHKVCENKHGIYMGAEHCVLHKETSICFLSFQFCTISFCVMTLFKTGEDYIGILSIYYFIHVFILFWSSYLDCVKNWNILYHNWRGRTMQTNETGKSQNSKLRRLSSWTCMVSSFHVCWWLPSASHCSNLLRWRHLVGKF